MTQLLYHIKLSFTSQILDRIRLLDELIEQAAFNQALVAHPEDKFAPVLVGDLTQLVDANKTIRQF